MISIERHASGPEGFGCGPIRVLPKVFLKRVSGEFGVFLGIEF
jgi:hypothetical protein